MKGGNSLELASRVLIRTASARRRRTVDRGRHLREECASRSRRPGAANAQTAHSFLAGPGAAIARWCTVLVVGEQSDLEKRSISVATPSEVAGDPSSVSRTRTHEQGERYHRRRGNVASHDHPQGTAADTLDRIRRGGTHLILAAQRRLAETKTLLDEGDFQAAMRTAAQLHEKISALADAEGSLGTVSDARIIKCGEIAVGMRLMDVGEVTAIDTCPCGQDECDRLVLMIEDHAVNLPADAELIVAAFSSE